MRDRLRRLGRVLAGIEARDVHFYGGLALIGFAPGWRWVVVGAVLAGYAVFGGLIARSSRRGE